MGIYGFLFIAVDKGDSASSLHFTLQKPSQERQHTWSLQDKEHSWAREGGSCPNSHIRKEKKPELLAQNHPEMGVREFNSPISIPGVQGTFSSTKPPPSIAASRSEQFPVLFSQIFPLTPESFPSSSWSLSQRDLELQSLAFRRERMAAWRVLCSRKLSFLPNYFHFVWLSDARMLFVPHPEAVQGNDSLSSAKTMPWTPTDPDPLYF